VLLILCGVAAGIALLLQAQFIRLYSRAQTLIQETLRRPQEDHSPEPQLLPPLLDSAVLRTLVLVEKSPVVGKTLRNLQLRTHSGTSVIAVRRGQRTLHNPDADVVLAAGDELLLLGDEDQLSAGEKVLNGVVDPSGSLGATSRS